MHIISNKRQVIAALAPIVIFTILTLSSCEVNHFITESSYRRQVESDLDERLSKAEGLRGFFLVDTDRREVTDESLPVGERLLTAKELEALEFLYAYMPLADLTDYPTRFYLQNVRYSFKAQDEMGWEVPERLFRHFVLPLRVNNENLDSSRVVFYREIKPRLEGLSMAEAVLEVNHWCHEKLTYQPSDARTLSPLACINSSLGRCGEEATFCVAALRAVGIPARQVYTPRWAHTDDNHAWVEAWADGKWYFMGACEPEPVLNLGWFNAPASRGILMHTRAFGRYDGAEEKVMEGPNFTEINLIDNYAETARVDFLVTRSDGQPVDSALVDFKIYNYAEFYPALSKYTDSEGRTFLTAGKGDMLVWASKDGKYGWTKVSFGTDREITVTLSDSLSFPPQDFMIVPPPEKAEIPEVTEEQRNANNLRTAQEDAIRKGFMATFAQDDGTLQGDLAAMAAGNRAVIEEFLKDHPDSRATDLLLSLSSKDLKDVTREILDDSYLDSTAILCPRVENEFLSPYKSFFNENLSPGQKDSLKDPEALISWVKDNIRLDKDPKAWKIPMSPAGVWRARYADVRSRNIFFVALSRTLGLDARKDPVTGKIQYRSGGDWLDVDFDSAASETSPSGRLVLNYFQTSFLKNPGYYTNFTISKISDGRTRLLTFDEGQVDMGGGVSWENVFKDGTSLDAGEYVLVSGNRLSDGSVPVSMKFFTIQEGQTTTEDLVIRIPDGKLPVIGEFDSETRYLRDRGEEPVSILSTTGRGVYVVGFLTARHEPSVHALNDLAAARADLEQWGRTILLLTTPDGYDWLKEYSDRLPTNVRFGIAPASATKDRQMPYFMVADTFNRVFLCSEGYNIGLGDQIVGALAKL